MLISFLKFDEVKLKKKITVSCLIIILLSLCNVSFKILICSHYKMKINERIKQKDKIFLRDRPSSFGKKIVKDKTLEMNQKEK